MTMHWRDEETEVLVGAWGPLFLGRNRGSLRMEDWRAVCDAVNAHHAAAGSFVIRNLAACKRRICALKEAAKGQPTSGWRQRHFALLHSFLAEPNGPVYPPPGFPAVNKEKEVELDEEEVGVEEASGWVGGSAGTREFPAKRRFSSLQTILEGEALGGPSPAKMRATLKKEAAVGCGCGCDCPAAVVTKLAGVYERVEMERLKVKKEEMESAKVKAEEKKPEGAEDN